MKEIWKPINGYEEFYQISNLGNVKSKPRQRTKGGILKTRPTLEGYLQVTLYKNSKPFTVTIHRIVAQNFIPNLNNLRCINHKDCNKKNNKVDNLEWCSYSQNSIHAIKHGLQPNNKYENNGQAKITKEKAEEIRRLYKTGKYFYRQIGEKFGICTRNVGKIINYDTWR